MGIKTLPDLEAKRIWRYNMDLTQSTLIASIYPGRKSQYQKDLANEIVIWNLRGWQTAKILQTVRVFAMSHR